MVVREQAYANASMENPERQLELHGGEPRAKPGMSIGHNRSIARLAYQLMDQLNWVEFDVRINSARVRHAEDTYYIPDIVVVPKTQIDPLRDRPGILEVYDASLPLIVEVWSPSTGSYDVDAKLPVYQRRGDLEVWRLHPDDRRLIAWRLQPDGSYARLEYRGGTVQPAALLGVTIDLDALFD